MQYLGIVVQSTVNNFQIQQLSAPVVFTESKLFPLQFGIFLNKKVKTKLDHHPYIHKTSIPSHHQHCLSAFL